MEIKRSGQSFIQKILDRTNLCSYNKGMDYEYDLAKNRSDIAKHGIPLSDAEVRKANNREKKRYGKVPNRS